MWGETAATKRCLNILMIFNWEKVMVNAIHLNEKN